MNKDRILLQTVYWKLEGFGGRPVRPQQDWKQLGIDWEKLDALFGDEIDSVAMCLVNH